ncbi:MAG: lipopolysaccharide biosynthesis protein [Sulfuricella sp.]|nr:lipopolysaccharide biosynthesis protein [Sulfuricella sp.]
MTSPAVSTLPLPVSSGIMRGTAWMMLLRLAERSVGLVSTLILARMLAPADFGLVAMAMAVVAMTELMGAFGFDTALIQRRDAKRAHYDTAWTFNILFAVGAALLLLLLAFPAAGFYREPRLQGILPILAMGALVQGFENIGTVAFRKELDFRREFWFVLSKRLATFGVTMALALMFRSYWALVGGVVTGKLFSVWISYRLHPYRPRFTLAARQDLFHFSKWLFFSNLVLFLQNKSADFILGRTVGAYGLGIYNVAFEIAALPSTELISPLNRVAFPAYSRLAEDLPELRRKFLEVFGVIALISFPVATGLACVAAPAVLVLLGNKWVEAIPLLRVLTIAGLIGALQSNLHLMIVALGKPKANTLVSTATLIVSLPIFVAASLRYGAVGAAWAFLVFSIVGLGTLHFVFFRLSGVQAGAYAATLWRPILSSAALALAVMAAERMFDGAFGQAGNALKLAMLVLVGALAYAVTILAAWRLSGRPDSAEKMILGFLCARLSRFKPGTATSET